MGPGRSTAVLHRNQIRTLDMARLSGRQSQLQNPEETVPLKRHHCHSRRDNIRIPKIPEKRAVPGISGRTARDRACRHRAETPSEP